MAKGNKRKAVTIVTDADAPPPFDDLVLAPAEGGLVSFTLIRNGLVAGMGTVTESVAFKAKCYLDAMFVDSNVIRFVRPM